MVVATVPRAGDRLDHFLAVEFPQLSRTRVQELIREGRARVDGVPVCRPAHRLRGGEVITFEAVARPALEAEPEAIPLRILYEDEDLLALDKPAGMAVHAGAGVRRGTVVNALLGHTSQLSTLGGPLRPGIVHRLDKGTSGVLLVAKNNAAHRALAEQFHRRQIEKRYWALLHGQLQRTRETIALPIARDRKRRTRMTTRRRSGRAAATNYQVLASATGFTLVEAFLHTGRTHQVRVHFSAIGHPVVGDTLYGAPRQLRWGNRSRPTLNRNFLHAQRIRFRHPRSGELREVCAPLPGELADLLQELGLPLPDAD